MKNLILIITLITSFNTKAQHKNPINIKDASILNPCIEQRFDNIGVLATFGSYTQIGVRSYGKEFHASISYCINRVEANRNEHGAQILVAWYKDLGKNKNIRLSIFTQVGLHKQQEQSTRIIYGGTAITATPIGVNVSFLLDNR